MNLKIIIIPLLLIFQLFYFPRVMKVKSSNFFIQKQAPTTPKPPQDPPPSGRLGGGGDRGNCTIFLSGQDEQQPTLTIIPIAPLRERDVISDSPTLWFYITYEDRGTREKLSGGINEQLSGDLKLEIFETYEQKPAQTVSLPQTSGLFSVSLSHELEPEMWYKWYLNSQDCEESDPLNVVGYLKQVQDVMTNIEDEQPLAQINEHIQNGLWYDAFNKAAELACNSSNTSELSEHWQTILIENRSVFGLDKDEELLNEIRNSSLICPE